MPLGLEDGVGPSRREARYHPELEASNHLGVLNATGGSGRPERGVCRGFGHHIQGPGSVGTFAGVLPPHPTEVDYC